MEKNIKGIKCDAMGCGWSNMDVEWDDIDATTAEWLNKPCPKCGANLLTEEDVESTKKMFVVLEIMEKVSKEIGLDNDEETTAKMISDGTASKKIITENGIELNLTPEMINALYEIVQLPEGIEIIKNIILTQQN